MSNQDLSKIVISKIQQGSRCLIFMPALEFTPTLDSNGLLCAEDNELNISVFASTREELLNELQQQIFMLWDSYAQAPDNVLTQQALDLKHRLLERMEDSDCNGIR